MLYLLTFNFISFKVMMLMFYNVQTTYLIFASRKMRYTLNNYTIA